MIQRHSSRRSRLDQSVLTQRLGGAVSYDRIAGYFRSSLFEVAGEALASVTGPVRIICNSDLDPQDLITAAAAQVALCRSWCAGKPEDAPPAALPRYRALYDALISKKMEVRVLPDSAFGLIHGKAGVVRRADGTATAFLGSVNESLPPAGMGVGGRERSGIPVRGREIARQMSAPYRSGFAGTGGARLVRSG